MADLTVKSDTHGKSWELWRSMYLLNMYRLLLGGVLLSLVWVLGSEQILGQRNLALFYQVNIGYIILTLLALPLVKLQKPSFNIQLGIQIGTDIVCIVLLSYASGGVASNLSILLLVSLAAAGLISRGRITLLFAALASIAVLLEHSYSVLTQDGALVGQYMQAGLPFLTYNTGDVAANINSSLAQLVMQTFEPGKWLASVNELLLNESFRKSIQIKMKQVVQENYTEEKYWQQLSNVYKKVLQ